MWLTGGEPTDHDILPLCRALHRLGFFVALATAGVKSVERAKHEIDWLSVSPHDLNKWETLAGQELKFVFGLNGLTPAAYEDYLANGRPLAFGNKYVCPCHGKPETVAQCMAWVETHRGWRVSVQAHKQWEIP